MFKKISLVILSVLILLPFVLVYLGNVSPPVVEQDRLTKQQIEETSHFYPKSDVGVHQVFLTGNDYERGQQYGYWTKDFLLKQEDALIRKLNEVIPYKSLQYGLFFFSMGWFYGLDDYYKKEFIQEMYGVSHYGSKENLYFASPFTRQLAYHGIHDMGQMMIDHGLVLGACTQAATPYQGGGWLIGRNFDFEAGKVFDEDKVLKWVFPDEGVPFVSVIFSGMVGVITGINQKGVYIAINAAGSDDRVRLGTPATLVVLEALQHSHSAKEAVEIIRKAKPLISDIYVVVDRSEKLYVVEKSPDKTRVLAQENPNVVTNHLRHPDWKDDEINTHRMNSNTTMARYDRALEILPDVKSPLDMSRLLRDKYKVNGQIAWGHRASIDALIASHSVIYDSKMNHLYVSRGPSLSQEYVGIDLEKSFQNKKPVSIESLPVDPDFSDMPPFESVKLQIQNLIDSQELAEDGKCHLSEEKLQAADKEFFSSHFYLSWARAQLSHCRGNIQEARQHYEKALELQPAYHWQKERIANDIKTL